MGLGLALLPALTLAQYRESRPIRGVWLRPLGTTAASLDPVLIGMAKAGLTDLYLETFYHGLSTGKAGVFRARFSQDYLAAAIRRAAPYGIRVTAWLESSYWQYGSSGQYLFDANPEYRVINVATGAPGGDQAQQVFANLTHPGVQAKLRAYTEELAAYPGLWGVQTDYHRMPLDNSTSDSFPAPWSYDATSAAAFQAIYGAGVNIQTQAAQTNQSHWNRFLTWRRNGISEAARQMSLGVQAGSPDVTFSAAVFTNPGSSAEISKCQDWPSWAAAKSVDWIVPMAYGFTTSNIVSEMTRARGLAADRRVVSGLAVWSGHPAATDQLTALKAANFGDFILFEGSHVTTVANQDSLRTWLGANATPMRADLTGDGRLDRRDWDQFLAVYRGLPVSAAGRSRLDFDGNGTIDTADHARFRASLRQFRLGDRGVLEDRDRVAFEASLTPATVPPSPYPHLFDFDGDTDVDAVDRTWMERIGNPHPMAFVRVGLGDWLGERQPITWTWVANGTPVGSGSATPAADEVLELTAPQAGALTLRVKASHWLSASIPMTLGTADLGGLTVTLRNGDIDGDNAVTVFDYDRLSDAFDTEPGAPGWNPSADLEGDGAVTVMDYDVLSRNFDAVGS